MAELTFDRTFAAQPGKVESLSPLVRRLLCGNASAFTFTGTSTFIVGQGHVAVIDPGPLDEAHFTALLAALDGQTVNHILVTHSHADHSPLAARLKAATGALTVAHSAIAPQEDGPLRLDASVDHEFIPDITLPHGETISGPGWTLEGVFTPGHMSNHMCFALREEKTLFAGDHVMAWATSVIAPPDGKMHDYMASLQLLLKRDDALYLPAHGPGRRNPKPLVRGYIAHRRMREAAILNRLRAGEHDVSAIVRSVYTGLDPRLAGAAALSARAHLEHLVMQGLARATGDIFSAT